MALRSTWKGSLRFSLVSIQVEAFSASEPGDGEIHLNQLHDECHSRIRYKKTCPIHGEVENSEIVTGFEYEKNHYVVIDKNEVEKAQTAGDKGIEIITFIKPDEIDPIYYEGKTYYLSPLKGSDKPYAVLAKAMEKENTYGIATVVMHTREHLVLIRPVEDLLEMTMLHYKSEIRDADLIRDNLHDVKIAPQELKSAEQLIEASTTADFDLGNYQDHYTDRLRTLIDSKIKGKDIKVPKNNDRAPATINLMEALMKSVKAKKDRTPKPSRIQRRKSS